MRAPNRVPSLGTATLEFVRRAFDIIDSRFVSRVGNALTLWSLLSLGAVLLLVIGLVGAAVIQVAGWIPLVCFGLWIAVACLLGVSLLLHRTRSSLASPIARIAIERGLPRASIALVNALREAEARGREFIAEAAILCPVNNQEPTATFADTYRQFEKDVASLVHASNELDERWELAWAHMPTWADAHLLEMPFTRGRLDVLVQYMAQRNRQLGWMLEYMRSGNDEPVRHVRHWATPDDVATVATASRA